MSDQEFKVYKERWVMLALFCFLNFSNAQLWVTFAPISDITSDYFDGIGVTAVNMLALIFQITYLPGSIIGVIVSKEYGLREAVLVGGILNSIGSFIRIIGAIFRNQLGSYGTYTLFMVGQLIGSLAQPIYVNLPAGIASDWFSVQERDMATTIASLFNPIGSAAGQVVPSIIVTEKDGKVSGMTDLMIVEGVICMVSLALAYVWFASKPPTPPSQSAMLKANISHRDKPKEVSDTQKECEVSDCCETSLIGGSKKRTLLMSLQEAWDEMKEELYELMKNKDYCILLVAFSIGLGLFNSFLTLIYQIIEPHGYTNDDAGTFAALLIFFGLVGAGIAGAVLDSTHKYREFIKGGFAACLICLFLFTLLLYSHNFIWLCVAFSVLGLSMMPTLPAALENCAECTYPIQEDLSVGLLFIMGNVIGIPMVVALQVLLKEEPWGAPPFLPSNLFILVIVLVACSVLYFYEGEYKRLAAEKKDAVVTSYKDAARAHSDYSNSSGVLVSVNSRSNLDEENCQSNVCSAIDASYLSTHSASSGI